MNPITHYQIVSERCSSRLEESVRKELKQGWQPIGAPFLADESNRGSPDFHQAMIKARDIWAA